MEREIVLPCYRTWDTAGPTFKQAFRFAPRSRIETLKNKNERIAGFIHRENRLLEGAIEVAAMEVGAGVRRITVTVSNLTECGGTGHLDHDSAMLCSMISAHTILEVRDGAFVSLLDPPEDLRDAAAGCTNVGTWPVLAGEKGRYDTMLSSPIILYDYPEIAAESPGELFDGTEIDEILTLRIMTMTDQEKDEMRRSDERARRILERTENLPPEHLAKLHGALRRHL
jgi:hydrogenase maturation protease